MNAFDEIRCLDLPLADQLAAYSDQMQQTNVQIAGIYSDIIERLRKAEAGNGAPQVGDRLPAFLLPDHSSRLISSANLIESGPFVISFNRGHWCSFCRLELLALNDIYPQIQQCGGELVSIMPERAPSVLQLLEGYTINFPILTDMDNGYALECGIMISLGQALRDAFTAKGKDLGRFQGNDGWFAPIPATFIIGRDGRIACQFVDPDFRLRLSPKAILECLEQIS